jgi:hypothetical protein
MVAGGVTFYLRYHMVQHFIRLDKKKKVDEWHHKWCFVHL